MIASWHDRIIDRGRKTIMSEDKTLLKQGMDLVDEMSNEELHLFIDYLRTVIKNRHQVNAAKAFMEIRIGDKVKISGNVKPMYLRGLTGVVDDKRQTRVTIALDRGPTKKFRSGKVICPPTAISRLED
jgi:ribosomal protein L21E